MPVVIQQRALASREAGWTDTVTFDQTDPATGVQSIVVSLTATLSSDVTVYSLEQSASSFTSTDTATVSLNRPDGSVLLAATPSTVVTVLLPAVVSSGSAAVLSTMLPATASATVSNSYAAGTKPSPDAALLVGTGTVTLPIVTTARVSAAGPGNFGAVFDSQVAAIVSDTATTTGTTGGSSGGSGSTVTISNPFPPIMVSSITAPVQHARIGAATTGWVQALGIAGFDPTLGQLELVNVTITTNETASLQAENLGLIAGFLGTIQTATVSLEMGSVVLDSQAATIMTGTMLGAFDGTVDGRGSSGEVISPRVVSTSGFNGLSSPAALAAFTGAAVAGVTVSGAGQTRIDGPGALSISGALQAGATIDVSYTYLPTAGALFDVSYYLAHNPDVAAAGVDPYQHYLQYGWHEGRDPSAAFDTVDYLAANPDVKAAGVNPLLHYRNNGKAEGRAAFAVPVAGSDPLVDATYVYATRPDVAKAGVDASTWFDTQGWKEGADPSSAFSTRDYLAANPDVARAGINPLTHYEQFGRAEGRSAIGVPTSGYADDSLVNAAFIYAQRPDVARAGVDAAQWFLAQGWKEGAKPDALFDTAYYLAQNPDVAAAHVDPLLHFEQAGWHEGRNPSVAFSTNKYLAAYADVRQAGIDPLLHYLQSGQAEGRHAFPA